MNKKKSILFFVTEDWYFISHRLKLALFLKAKGYNVHLCCKNTGQFETILKQGIKCYDIKSRRKSLSGFHLLGEVISLVICIKKVKPSILHLISLRPAVVGMIASLLFKKIHIFITFTGLGFIFIRQNIITKTLRFILQIFFFVISRTRKVFAVVQNKDDYSYFLKNFFFRKDRINIIRGSGIDLKIFKKIEEKKSKKILICYLGRMLKDKGVHWLIKGFKLAKKENKKIFLILAGELDNNNPTSFDKEEFKKIVDSPDIKHLGNIKDVRKVLNKCHIGALLSKREGLPMSLMEIAAVGRPIIATDVPGCREVAINKFNAITVSPGDVSAVKDAILELANNKKLRLQYGKNSRKIIQGGMENDKIFKEYLNLYES